jgi:hypothetical protein
MGHEGTCVGAGIDHELAGPGRVDPSVDGDRNSGIGLRFWSYICSFSLEFGVLDQIPRVS